MVDIPRSDILLLDDHAMVAEGFKELLVKILPKHSTIQIFVSIEKAMLSLEQQKYHFLMVDLLMPGQNAKNFISYCRGKYPHLIILVLSTVIDVHNIKNCLALGANGYISKAVTHHEIKFALENTYKGNRFVSSDLSSNLATSLLAENTSRLTPKELEILCLIAKGHKTSVMAEMLHVSPLTIMTHKRNLLQKLNLHSATELVKYAYDNSLV
ncbi:LuxR C-terminal-related transcriptional regulator [Niabella sp. CJ426]|uniref:LuxR C-terminal-related transcriptional regulator n=1 Tax=Niabella sp. CJ426 TaxID=3393740 RepID=UPI003D012458